MNTPGFKKWFADYDTYRKTHQQIANDAWEAGQKDRTFSFQSIMDKIFLCTAIYAVITMLMFWLFGPA